MNASEQLSRTICRLLARIRETRPLIHVVTNFVVMNQTANALLAVGASPTMSWAGEDAAYLSQISDALCINTGTPVADRVDVMKALLTLAEKAGKPVVLDPVGAGAGPYRTAVARQLNALAPGKIIRGNASEICALAGAGVPGTRGVENSLSPEQAKEILLQHGRAGQGADEAHAGGLPGGAAQLFRSASAVVISGAADTVVGRERMAVIRNGSPLMGAVTGTGCVLSALIAAFHAVTDKSFEAAVAAVAAAGIAGEIAAEKANGPGFFMGHFIDGLYGLDETAVAGRLNVEIRELTPV